MLLVEAGRQADITYHFGKKTGIDFNIVELGGGKAVMNGLSAGDLDIGWVAGAQAKFVRNGDMVNIARAIAPPLNDSPDAPMITDLGSDYLMEGYFMFVAPGDIDPAAQKAITTAIIDVLKNPDSKAATLVNRAFGKATTISGEALGVLVAEEAKATKALLADVSD